MSEDTDDWDTTEPTDPEGTKGENIESLTSDPSVAIKPIRADADDTPGINEELEALNSLEALLDQEEQSLADTEPSGDDSNDEQPDFPPALNVCPEKFLPSDAVACKTCPMAKWYGNDRLLKCWCRDMFQVVYDKDTPGDAVTYCDRRKNEGR